MDAILIYFLKANGLLISFYLVYYFLLRKETFFIKSRYFLLFGLVASLLLPLLTFTKTVWVEPIPIEMESAYSDVIPVSNQVLVTSEIPSSVNWNEIIYSVYAIITFVLLLKIIIELLSFFKFIKIGKRTIKTNYTLIDQPENQNPFSFFNYIVYNSSQFTTAELQHILEHEKIHILQKHSLDVLLAKLFCAFFWVNPIMWLYRKEILQNLEYIADNFASLKVSNSINYQKTLLKVVLNQNQLTITNQFYQSLIKKRIVMLNKNQSNKKNTWKYTVIIPAIIAFVILFQVKVIAQIKVKNEAKPKVDTTKLVSYGVITFSTTTDKELAKDAADLKKEGIEYKVSNIQRNSEGEITTITIEYEDNQGNNGIVQINENEPIKPIYLNLDKNLGKIGFTKVPDLPGFKITEKTSGKFGNIIKVKEFKIGKLDSTGFQKTRKLRLVNESKTYTEEQLWIINGKEYLSSELPLDKIMTSNGITKELSSEESIAKYGEKGKNGVIIMEGETKFISNEIIEAKYKNSAKTRLESDKDKIDEYLLKAKETTRRKRMLDEMSEKNKLIQKQLEKSLNAKPTIPKTKYFNGMKNDSTIINK